MESKGEIIIYQAPDGTTDLDVRLENETVWLTQAQMIELFARERSVITKHVNNIFKEGELDEKSNVQNLHIANSDKPVKFYNLDVIISVGYRVKSQRGTQFRIWANKVLKEYLIKGYVVHDKIKAQQYEDLRQTVQLLSNVMQHKELNADEATGLLQVITDYTYALDTLDKYDYQQLTVENTTADTPFHATYDNAMEAIHFLRHKFGGSNLFGNEKDQSFRSSIATIYQTFGGVDLYPSIEEKAAMLLYLVTKNHSFSDGNKRIAAFLFLWFMEENGILYRTDGSKLIENNTLVALTLMIAESRTEEKDVMVKVIVNLINRSN
ncbi:MAG: virulence protein RhuM/Fic/DOC family protein [Prevotellaceae bacterium]|jgi:prophage maintenance system killer protein|nr:virulence protein RhuM/Fic/DOC family protein [Prevotellaceae bacterium]